MRLHVCVCICVYACMRLHVCVCVGNIFHCSKTFSFTLFSPKNNGAFNSDRYLAEERKSVTSSGATTRDIRKSSGLDFKDGVFVQIFCDTFLPHVTKPLLFKALLTL